MNSCVNQFGETTVLDGIFELQTRVLEVYSLFEILNFFFLFLVHGICMGQQLLMGCGGKKEFSVSLLMYTLLVH